MGVCVRVYAPYIEWHTSLLFEFVKNDWGTVELLVEYLCTYVCLFVVYL